MKWTKLMPIPEICDFLEPIGEYPSGLETPGALPSFGVRKYQEFGIEKFVFRDYAETT
jgi:hypothetical protein